jgi:hypothetical protein
MLAAAVDDAAPALLAAWDIARQRATPLLSGPQLSALLIVELQEGINLRPSSRQLLDHLRTTRRELLTEVLERMPAAGRAALLRGLLDFAAAAEPPAHESGRKPGIRSA